MSAARPVFVDTSYLVALLNRRDKNHDGATALAARWHRLDTPLTTTDAVLVETHDWFSRSPLRVAAAQAMATLRRSPGWTIVHASLELIARAERRFVTHGDNEWSLTDCISVEAAKDARVREIATTDRHFEQAGFQILLAT